ncbi:hypothetical protein [Candidatus Nanohalovita haloferacivicina]|uniref:hypothetical protein n=1 Tax=Candidatus Nanohalovita haloferacivicina TaxID=2978046 RepID=UPI00325F9B84|nr:hypothetical protein HBNXNv_0809 [Candidatus Nanohalobia archaeon BNXNv]
MKVEIKPTEKPEQLVENLEKRAETAEINEDHVIAEVENPALIERLPGVEKYWVDGEEREGLKGRPVQEQVYCRIESKEDLVKAFLATIDGYDLRILSSGDDWDLRMLKRFNPDIKELEFDEPKEVLGIEKALFPHEGLEEIEIEVDDEEIQMVYEYMMY